MAILGVFISLPEFRTKILTGELKPKEIVQMNKEDFVSVEKKKK